MATCPDCGINSRDPSVPMHVERILAAKPVGSYSLSGTRMKAVLVTRYRMFCRCGWSLVGDLVDGYFVGEQPGAESG